MHIKLSRSQFIQKMLQDEYASWTYEQADVIFDYIEAYEMANMTDVEFDLPKFRGIFNHFDTLDEATETMDDGTLFLGIEGEHGVIAVSHLNMMADC